MGSSQFKNDGKDLQDVEIINGRLYAATSEITVANGVTVFGFLSTTLSDNLVLQVGRIEQATSTQPIELIVKNFEGVATTADGSIATKFNLDRNRTEVGTIEYHSSPTGVTGGIELPFLTVGITADKNELVQQTVRAEYIMKKNTKYALQIENLGLASVTLRLTWIWSER